MEISSISTTIVAAVEQQGAVKQQRRFIEVDRAAGCSEGKADFDSAPKLIVKPKVADGMW